MSAAAHEHHHFDPAMLDALGVPVKRLCTDSRVVGSGEVFLAYRGERLDGREFIPAAIAAGAGAVLWEPQGFEWKSEWRVPNMAVPRLRARASAIAGRVCGDPSARLRVVGVTGTNGKTSCAQWMAQALAALGSSTALVGTLGSGFPGRLAPGPNTTPDPVLLQEQLAAFLDGGAAAVAMEVSSHAVEQGRVNGVRFAAAVFTNLSRDHLDYHGDMESYYSAKARLFRWPGLAQGVVNLDDAWGRRLAGELAGEQLPLAGFGFDPVASSGAPARLAAVRGSGLAVDAAGVRFTIESPWGGAVVESPVVGRFNASNLLGVAATLMALGTSPADAARGLTAIGPVPGRMERMGGGDRPLVVIDYAHTPDALEKALLALREVMETDRARGTRLTCVFGCGGLRDRGKRPMMGEVASRLADRVVVTSDNPRSEDPRAIIEEIVAGARANHHIEDDRAAAIWHALHEARAGDVVLVAGKGHEDYQEVNGQRLPFRDQDVVRVALGESEK